MAPQQYVGADGDTYNAYTVQSIIEKSIDAMSRRHSIFGGLGWDQSGVLCCPDKRDHRR